MFPETETGSYQKLLLILVQTPKFLNIYSKTFALLIISYKPAKPASGFTQFR